jgi:glycosyltransferase involved in cell wall biosynthesis
MRTVDDAPNQKILLVVEQLRRTVPGGIGSYARGLLSGLDACADEWGEPDLTLFASRSPNRLGGRQKQPKGSVADVEPLRRFGRPVLASHLPGLVLTRAWDRGWRRAPRGYDVVHSVSLAAPSARQGRARTVVTVHDLAWRRHPEATTPRGRRWHERALLRALNSDAAVVVTSDFVAADLLADGVDPARITVVHGGSDHLEPADPVATSAVLGELGVTGEFLLTVSTLEPRKNVDRLLEAYAGIRHQLPEPWPLVIVGPTGWGQAPVDPGEYQGVVFAGAVSDAVLTGLYERARAFVYVPLTEGYGLPPLEAMRAGTPVVVSNEVPSVRDLEQTGTPPAIIVDPLDVDGISAALLRVLMDETVRADLVARGHAHTRARTWRTAAAQHLTLWRSLA